jgi:hypothetical protein
LGSNSAERESAVPVVLTQLLSLLHVGQFKSRRQSRRTFIGRLTEVLRLHRPKLRVEGAKKLFDFWLAHVLGINPSACTIMM